MYNYILSYFVNNLEIWWLYLSPIKKRDDVEMLRQLRLLYMRLNEIIRMFYFCTVNVKLELFRSSCTQF